VAEREPESVAEREPESDPEHKPERADTVAFKKSSEAFFQSKRQPKCRPKRKS